MILRRLARSALLAVLVCGAAVPPPAAAEQTAVDVTIEQVSTATLDVGDPQQVVELSGTLSNTSTSPISWLNVSFVRRQSPLRSAEALAGALAKPTGTRLSSEAAGNVQLPVEQDLRPGQSVPFTVRATVAELGFTVDDAAYLIGVDVRGIPGNGTRRTLGHASTVIAATGSPTTSAAVVLLTAPPSRLPNGFFVDDSLGAELAGRLDELLSSAERPGVMAAIDPALYDAAVALAASHTVADQARPGNPVAAAWVARVDALAARKTLWRLPYANADLEAAHAAGKLPEVAAWANEASASLAGLPRMVLLRHEPDEEMAQALSGVDTVVAQGATGADAGQPRVLGAPLQSVLAALPEGQRLGRRIAEELVSEHMLYVIDSPQAAAADMAGTPLLRVHALPGHDHEAPVTWASSPESTAPSRVATAFETMLEDTRLLADLSGISLDVPVIGATAFSSSFPDEEAAVGWLNAAGPRHLDLDRVSLVAAQSYVMGARTSTFPLTLNNQLGVPVTVRVEFASDAPQRIWVPPVEQVTVEPGQSMTLNISPQASANGVTMVHAQLYTQQGRPIGEPVAIEITATDFGRVGWVIIAVSGAVVLGGTAWRIRTVRSERAQEAAQ